MEGAIATRSAGCPRGRGYEPFKEKGDLGESVLCTGMELKVLSTDLVMNSSSFFRGSRGGRSAGDPLNAGGQSGLQTKERVNRTLDLTGRAWHLVPNECRTQ